MEAEPKPSLKPLDYKIIAQLVRNSKQSDRQLAKTLNVSQPTITRRRIDLERKGLLDYTAVPNLGKLGFQILAFIFGKWDFQEHPTTHVEEMKDFISKHPQIVYISTGSGLNFDRMAIAFFKDYSEYSDVMQEYKASWGKYFTNFSSFIVSLKSDNILRPLTFKPLTKSLVQDETKEP
jgi:DNA-binding Lrp family transcriptional regulator